MAVLIKETWIEIENDPGAMIILEEQLEAAKCWIDFEHLREDPEAYASEDESEDESDDESEDERDSNDEGGDDKGPDQGDLNLKPAALKLGDFEDPPAAKRTKLSSKMVADEPDNDKSGPEVLKPPTVEKSLKQAATNEQKISLADSLLDVCEDNPELKEQLLRDSANFANNLTVLLRSAAATCI